MNKQWFAIETYSGFENTIKRRLLATPELKNALFNVIVPEYIDSNTGSTENLFPGFIFIELDYSEEAFHHVKLTPFIKGYVHNVEEDVAVNNSTGNYNKDNKLLSNIIGMGALPKNSFAPPLPIPTEEINEILNFLKSKGVNI